MSDALTEAAAPIPPDPDRAVSARLDSAGAGNILRTLCAYGRNLVQTLRQNNHPGVLPWYPFLASIFGTSNPAPITVTIIRGLLRLTALQARLSSSLPRVHDSLLPLPLRDDRPAKRIDGGSRPGHGQHRATGWVFPPGWPTGHDLLDRLPTPERETFAEIVAEDRDRPIAAILLDICLDLGIVAALTDPATRAEFVHDLTLYGGDPATLLSRSEYVQNSTLPATLAAAGEARSGNTHTQPRRPDSRLNNDPAYDGRPTPSCPAKRVPTKFVHPEAGSRKPAIHVFSAMQR